MFTAPKIVPRPDTPRPKSHISAPVPGECTASVNGVYAVQPKSAAPPGVMNPAIATVEPNTNNQKLNAFNRGNATSGAPICNGNTTLANPITIGVAYISNITVPCMVNNWLYCSVDKRSEEHTSELQ